MCTLCTFGSDLDVDAFLKAVPLSPAAVHRRGEARLSSPGFAGRLNKGSTINGGGSDADFSNLAAQLADAQVFLLQHLGSLKVARSHPGVEGLVLDVPIEDRSWVQSDRFPALLAALGALGIDLEISRYPQPGSPSDPAD